MKTLLTACLAICATNFLFAQLPVAWQSTYGGSSADEIRSVVGTADGGVIVGGTSASGISGSKSMASYGANDYWVIKYDVDGTVEWQQAYGGSGNDNLFAILQTSDGGYLLGGTSFSGATGNKSEGLIGVSDYWIIKTDGSGIIQWQNAIGGSNIDDLTGLTACSDGGYLISGHSNSGISGDKTENAVGGSADYWIVKINSTGTIQWQNAIGGNNVDVPLGAVQNPDGTYTVAGYSLSGATGEKSEPTNGNYDYWVLNLSATGTLIWQNAIGGNGVDLLRSIAPAIDGGVVIGGYSGSGITGDKTEALIGIYDYWVLKLNSVGAIVWQNTIGGTSDDYLFSIVPNATENAYLLAGYSYSGIGGDKTETGDATANYWMVEIDLSGTLINQETLLASNYDFGYAAGICTDGGYTMGGKSNSGISGDKTDANYGDFDYWLVKMEPPCNPLTEVCNTVDDDCDGLIDEDVQNTYYADADADDFGDDASTILACEIPEGYTTVNTDCNDANAEIYPGATEVCNTLDDDCDALIDEDLENTISISPVGGTVFCQGGSVVLIATHTGTGLQWKRNGVILIGAVTPEYTALTTGVYTCLSYSDCDTTESAPINVSVNKNPKATINAGGPTNFCAGGSVVLSVNPVGGSIYQWYRGGTMLAGATGINYTATVSGNYKCLVTKTATGCFKMSNVIPVTVTCREDDLAASNGRVEVYPNPAADNIQVDFNFDFDGDVKIFNQTGELMATHSASQFNTIDIHDLPAGVYILLANDSNMNKIAYFVKQ